MYLDQSVNDVPGPYRLPYNNAVNAPVRPVTPLAEGASGSPVQPARYRERWTDDQNK